MSKMAEGLPSQPKEETFPDDDSVIKKFEEKEPIPGMLGNFQFYAHGKEVKCMEKSKNYNFQVNSFENDLVLGLSRHLLLNNVRIEQFQIMCNSENRIRQLKQHFEQHGGSAAYNHIGIELVGDKRVILPGNHVSILLLVSVRGENEEDNFVKSILQTIKNSRSGVIIIASFRIISEASTERWLNLLKTMNDLNYINPFIMIQCQKHNQVCRTVQNSKDLKLSSPLGGCLQFCRTMDCGHFCDSVCHPAYSKDHDGKVCTELCNETCSSGHPCIMECHEPCVCVDGCLFLRDCGHPLNHKQECDSLCLAELPCGKHRCLEECGECEGDPGHEKIVCSEICDKNCASGRHPCGNHYCNEGCPPCQIEVIHELPDCSHTVVRPCYQPFDGHAHFCLERCQRRYGVCGHHCEKRCGEECGICEVISKRPHPSCGHLTNSQCNFPITAPCRANVLPACTSNCGHSGILVPCKFAKRMTPEKLPDYCRKKCDRVLNEHEGDCGHYCFGNCYECNNGKMHVRCETPCEKNLLCGHSCKISCPMVCPPCIAPCMSKCEHTKCPYECGVPCENTCQEPCPYSCPHLSCTQICGAVCDRPGCFEPCTKILDCGHDCAGFCGEQCPKGCRICTPKLLIDYSSMSTLEVLEAGFTYITIQPCGHSIEESDLTRWINQVDELREIKYKCCPHCRQPIQITLRRYSSQIREAWVGVQEIKRKIIGSEIEIAECLEGFKKYLNSRMEADPPATLFMDHAKALLSEASQPMKTKNVHGYNFESMHLGKVKFIQWAIDQWVRAEDICSMYEHLWNVEYIRKLMHAFQEIFRLMLSGYWPLHPNEVNSIMTELERIKDMEQLYDRLSLVNDEQVLTLGYTREGKIRFRRAEDVLQKMGPYSAARKAEFTEKFLDFCIVQKYTLNISDKERVEIVQAFGSRAGRWFKCPNGHVYVVTECGGMTEIGQCNECGALIGGESHKLIQSNQLASEMDGAEGALWPTVLDP